MELGRTTPAEIVVEDFDQDGRQDFAVTQIAFKSKGLQSVRVNIFLGNEVSLNCNL